MQSRDKQQSDEKIIQSESDIRDQQPENKQESNIISDEETKSDISDQQPANIEPIIISDDEMMEMYYDPIGDTYNGAWHRDSLQQRMMK